MYDAFARDVLDDRTVRKRRIKKVGIWTLQLAAQALFLGLAGNIAWFDDETRVDVNKTWKRERSNEGETNTRATTFLYIILIRFACFGMARGVLGAIHGVCFWGTVAV
jgi:hypothetical protein